jgi:predicted GIY-YIG superfamily endonuclease
MEFIYVLECEHGRFYVGKTSNPIQRLEQHLHGAGAEFTRRYAPFRLHSPVRPMTSIYDEDNTVKEMMKVHGIDHVRGGSYSQVHLPPATKAHLKREIFSSMNACLRCGRNSHMANACFAKSDIYGDPCDDGGRDITERARKLSPASSAKAPSPGLKFVRSVQRIGGERAGLLNATWTSSPNVHTHVHDPRVFPVDDIDESIPPHKKPRTARFNNGSIGCFRCRRDNHYAADCFAKYDIHGNPLR